MSYYAIKLFPPDIFRIRVGDGRIDKVSSMIHSDTLFSAIVNCYIKLFGDSKVKDFVDRLLISSLLYGIRIEEREILFLPKPIIDLRSDTDLDVKLLKRIEWISIGAFKRVVDRFNGSSIGIDIAELSFLNSRFLISKDEDFREGKNYVDFISTSLEPKVSLEREHNTSKNLYFQEELEIRSIELDNGFKVKPFLYFIVKNPQDELFYTMNLLIEEGIGGERSFGKGVFNYWEKDSIEIPDDGNYGILLSLVTPKKEEIDSILYYGLVKRDGFIYHNGPVGIRKKRHYKLSEGSLVRLPFEGQNIDVSPIREKSVISYGKSLYWALKAKEGT